MESSTGAALTRLAVAQINPIRFTCGNYSKRAAVALPVRSIDLLPPSLANHFGGSPRLLSSRFQQKAV
jgi:hypothetical protein